MAAALVPLQNITLGSAQTTVTFASIPTTGYRDLRIVISAKPNGTGYPIVSSNFNGDTGANYQFVRMAGNGSTTNSTAVSGQTYNNWASSYGLGPTAGAISNFEIDVFDYAEAKHKTALVRANTPNAGVEATASRWASTSAVTSVSINAPGDSFAAGSTFALYGVVA